MPASRHPADALLERGADGHGHETLGFLLMACKSARKRLQPLEEAPKQVLL